MSDKVVKFVVQEGAAERLDKTLVAMLPDYSRSRLQSLIKDGCVTVNQNVAAKGGRTVESGDEVEIKLPASVPSALVPENIPLNVIYEDSHLMVINKPAGMVVHPAAGHSTGTLVQAALAHAPEMGGEKSAENSGRAWFTGWIKIPPD